MTLLVNVPFFFCPILFSLKILQLDFSMVARSLVELPLAQFYVI